MSTIRTFEDLDCWKAAREFRLFVSEVVRQFPKEEAYALSSQIRNSSRSVSHNIAEGYGRFHYLDNAKFCRNSRGSLFEALDQLITARDENYISAETLERGRLLFDNVLRPLNGYINYLCSANEKNNVMKESEVEYGVASVAPRI